MEMEHINENTIRVLIQGEDLVARGITFIDLLGNHQEIESFFYSILEEVDVEEQFIGSEAVTFQVLPKGDGLELIISKNLSPDEMTPYEIFTDQFTDDELLSIFTEAEEAQHQEEAVEELLSALNTKQDNDKEVGKRKAKKKKIEEKIPEVARKYVFALMNFEAAIYIAASVILDDAQTSLYMLKDHYYLSVRFTDDLSETLIKNSVAHISEFARLVEITEEVLFEHGQAIMSEDALGTINKYFEV